MVVLKDVVVCLLPNVFSYMLVYARDASTQTTVRATTLRKKLQIKLSILPIRRVLTQDQRIYSDNCACYHTEKKSCRSNLLYYPLAVY